MHCGYASVPTEPKLPLVSVQASEPPLYIRQRILSIQYSLTLGSSPSNLGYNTVFSPKFKASFSSKPTGNHTPTLGIRIACCQTHMLVWMRWEVVDQKTMYKYLKAYTKSYKFW